MFLFLCWNRELNVKKQGKSNIPLLESTYYINRVIIKIQYFWDKFQKFLKNNCIEKSIGMFGSSKKICSCFFTFFDVCSLIRNITIHQGTKKNVIPFSSFLIFFFFFKECGFRWFFISFVSPSLYAWHFSKPKFTSIVLLHNFFNLFCIRN